MRFYTPILVLLWLIPSMGWSQSVSDKTSEEQLKGYIYDFCQAYENLPSSKDKNSVLRYISKKATYAIFYFNVSNRVRQATFTYDGFNTYLDRLTQTEGMEIVYNVQDILRIYVNDEVATTAFSVNYEIKQADGFHVKGNENVTFGWKKINDLWQVVHFTVLGTEDEKLRGTCLCEVFASRGRNYIVRTTVPAGKSYTKGFHEFDTRVVDKEAYLKLNSDGSVFRLNPEGELWEQEGQFNDPGSQVGIKKLGMTRDIKGAVLLIVKSHIYPDNCTNIKYAK